MISSYEPNGRLMVVIFVEREKYKEFSIDLGAILAKNEIYGGIVFAIHASTYDLVVNQVMVTSS